MDALPSIDIVQKINDLKHESKEHKLVLDYFKDLEPTRRCFQLVGGVLVEGTVASVEPMLTENCKRIESFIDNMESVLQKRREQQADPKNKDKDSKSKKH